MSVMLLLLTTYAYSRVTLPAIFGNNMVLQQQAECNLWGTANAGREVKVSTSWDRHIYKVKTDNNGRWELKVNTPSSGGPYSISFNDGTETRLDNILIGEIWLCSGQSNMEMPMKGFKAQPVEGAVEELMQAFDSSLRLFTVKRNAALQAVDTLSGQWQEAEPVTVRNFSATAYYFGKQLRKALNVPVGLIVTAWGGSACEAWMQSDWLKAFPSVKQQITLSDVKSLQQRCPTALYNAMLNPLVGFTIRGTIWYQGEDNVNRSGNYAELFSTMIRGWRKEWKQGDFPFYYCQIAPYDYSLIGWNYNSAMLREQQMKVEKLLHGVRMAVLMDAGLQYGIHPRMKRETGQRLALLALSNTYNIKGLPDFATFSRVEFKNDTAIVSFDRSKEWVYFNDGPESKLFEVAGEDRVFHPAKAWVNRNKVYVKSDNVKSPVAVRYAFKNWVKGDLMHDGLPVSSFRTDDW